MLTVITNTHQYKFEGPYDEIRPLKNDSGVYLISTLNNAGGHDVIDIGESSTVQDRASMHDRADDWRACINNGLYYSACYCDENKRMALEKELRAYFDPPCGDR